MKLSFHVTQFAVLIGMCWCATNSVSAQDTDRRYMINSSPAGFQQVEDEGDDTGNLDVLLKINPLRKPMSSLSVEVRELSTDAPQDRSNKFTDAYPDTWTTFAPSPIAYAWTAPNIRYQPLFFENVKLERYGQTRGPWREVGDSSFHFFSSVALWPYHGHFDDYRECDHPLGFCRPGNHVPATKQLQWWGW